MPCKKKRTTHTESQVGNPAFLAEARRALDGIAPIVARIAPRPGKVDVALSGIAAERDEYVAVPPRPDAIETPGQELSHSEPMGGITAERDEYVGVPRRPGAVEAPDRELSHPEPMAGITAERDEYVAVPRRPGTVEAPGQELSHSEPMAGIMAERDEYVGVPRRPDAIEAPEQELSHPEPMAGIMAERDEYVGVPRRPDATEAPEQELSHSEPMADITAEHGKRRSKERKRPVFRGFFRLADPSDGGNECTPPRRNAATRLGKRRQVSLSFRHQSWWKMARKRANQLISGKIGNAPPSGLCLAHTDSWPRMEHGWNTDKTDRAPSVLDRTVVDQGRQGNIAYMRYMEYF